MASTTTPKKPPKKLPAADARPTKYYFAYGSNLHIKQMKRRCPNSKFIGKARLSNYRWQINERGYANVTKAEGHWVDGLVYEIDADDEAKLDVNEGVSKNAYNKRYMTVLLHRAQSALYRRPISWIVDNGGPAAVCKQVKRVAKDCGEHPRQWEDNVLIYINPNYIEDSDPRDEYVKRINLGIADARALGIDEDYIRNCIRPFIPESAETSPAASAVGVSKGKAPSSPAARGRKAAVPPARSAEPSPARKARSASPARKGPSASPARKGPSASRPNLQIAPRSSSRNPAKKDGHQSRDTAPRNEPPVLPPALPPPLPPRPPADQFHDIPIIVVEEVQLPGWGWWPSFDYRRQG